ncbi:hypothetical protein [Kitasatospora mediocidica]|uniref:hypothetical protein n=1 Tax=Kitasatospora mediocidica TaxID=58352 RepID=UPI00055E6E0F|nr:hypothetical protein [Kitasatospora mediocidica]
MIEKLGLRGRAEMLTDLSSTPGWVEAVRRATRLVEPKWQPDGELPRDMHAVHALDALALLLLAAAMEYRSVARVTVDTVRELVTAPDRATALIEERIPAIGDAKLTSLAESLLREHVPLPSRIEVPAYLEDTRGVPLRWGLAWLPVLNGPEDVTAA